MPRQRPPAIDNLILDGLWAHSGRDLSRAAIDVYPPLCYIQMSLARTLARPLAEQRTGADRAAVQIVAARAISALMTLGTAALVGWIGWQLGGQLAAILAAALLLFNPATIYYGHTTNAEATYVFYLTLAFALLLRWLADEQQRWPLIGFFLAGGAATAAKDQAAFLLIGPMLWTLWRRPRQAAPGMIAGGALWLGLFLVGGDVWLLPRHLMAMRAVATEFYTHSTGITDLAGLSGRFGWDVLRVVGPVALIGCLVWIHHARADERYRAWTRVLACVFLPYLLAILLLAHRTNPRYALPLLPLAAGAAGAALAGLARRPRGALLLASLMTGLLLWAAGLVLHLQQDPVDQSKRALREALADEQIPARSRVALFTVQLGKVYRVGPDNTWVPRRVARDWSRERYGWVCEGITVVGLPSALVELEGLKPELAIYADRDKVARPRRDYLQAGRFTPPFAGFYNYLQRQEGLTLYIRTE